MRISDWSSDVCSSDLGSSSIARLALVYLGYFLASALWSDGFSLAASADLLRVTLLVLLFLAMTVHLASSDARFTGRLFFWIAASAGASLVAVFAAAAGRKGVVEGTGVAVRLDLGGRRCFKK